MLKIIPEKYKTFGAAIIAGVVYGVIAQIIARTGNLKGESGIWRMLFLEMSLGFIFIVPFVIGALTVYRSPEAKQKSVLYCIFMPWLSSLLCLFISLIIGWEGSICVVMAGIIFLPLSSVGGLLMGFLLRRNAGRKNIAILLVILFLPLISGIAEATFELPTQFERTENSIRITASPEAIWKKIVRVEKITEKQESFFYTMGFPKPVEATLSFEGVGGVRQASFERGLLFVETITKFEPLKKLAFDIKADPKQTPLTTLDAHVTVGGRYFDVLSGEYRIERISEKESILHLGSTHRISTRFNFYSIIWSRYLMSEIQRNILKVIKLRAENADICNNYRSCSY